MALQAMSVSELTVGARLDDSLYQGMWPKVLGEIIIVSSPHVLEKIQLSPPLCLMIYLLGVRAGSREW